MTYSIDLRQKVIKFVTDGGSKTEACRVFSVDRKTIYNWLDSSSLTPKKHSPRTRKINKSELIQFVKDNNDMILREYAEHFGVHINAIWSAFRSLGIRKKNDEIQGTYVYKKD